MTHVFSIILIVVVSCSLFAGLGFLVHSLLKPKPKPSPKPSPGYSSMYKDFAAFQNRPMNKHPTPAPYTTCNYPLSVQTPDKWKQYNCADGQYCSRFQGCVLPCETDDDCKALFGSNNPGEDKATLKCGAFEEFPKHRYCMFVYNPRCSPGKSDDMREKRRQSCINVNKDWTVPPLPTPFWTNPDKYIDDVCSG